MIAALLTAIAAFLLLFLGERTFGTNDVVRIVLDVLGIGSLGAAFVVRFLALQRSSGEARTAWVRSLSLLGVATFGLVLYGLTLEPVASLLPLSSESAERLDVVLSALWPILVALGLVPMVMVERAIASAPVAPHPRRVRQALEGGLAAVLAIAMLFPMNYLGKEYNKRWDLTFFQTSMPGTQVRSIVENLEQPMRVVLFFPASSEVAQEAAPYFDALEGANLSVERVDQAMEPALAKEMKVRENGVIAMSLGERTEIVKLDVDFDKAKKNLRKLDSLVQTAMLKLAKGSRTAYFTVGHGEMGWKGSEDQARKATVVKKLFESANFKVKELGLGDGLASAIPDDATAVFILGPTDGFLPEEVATLNRYREAGGRIFIAVDPGAKEGVSFDGLLEPLGLKFSGDLVVTDEAKTYLPMNNGKTDRQNIGTNRYSSHESVTTLSKNSKQAWMVFLGAGELIETAEHGGKVTVTVRTLAKTWADLDGNYEFDKDTETRAVKNIAAVASGPALEGKEYRAVVVADSGFASDLVIANPANTQFLADATFWLIGEEDLAGTVNNEEDVKIVHNKEGQGIWFYGSTFLLPTILAGLGFLRVRSRRTKEVA